LVPNIPAVVATGTAMAFDWHVSRRADVVIRIVFALPPSPIGINRISQQCQLYLAGSR